MMHAVKFGVCVYNIRFLMDWLPFAMVPFTREVVRLGGAERAYLLLTIARFDIDGNRDISEEEYQLSRVNGEKCVNNAVAGCANFAIISALLFGAAHALTMGRPKPFAPDPKTVEEFGDDATNVAIWCAYALNAMAQSLALGIIITSIYIRQLLTNTLPSVISKLVFLSDTNVLSNLGIATTWLLACLVYLIMLGGFLSVPTYGFLSLLIFPVLVFMLVPTVYPAFLKSSVRLHAEINAVLEPEPTIVEDRAGGAAVHPAVKSKRGSSTAFESVDTPAADGADGVNMDMDSDL